MPYPTHNVAVRHPETGFYESLNPAIDYDPNDPLVKSFPWAFAPREEVVAGIVESVSIEKATAEPGEKRTRGRAKKATAEPGE